MEIWKEIILGNYITIITDYHSNGSYKDLKKHTTIKYTPEHAIMVRIINFKKNDFEKDLIYLNKFEYEYLSKTKVFAGDILMNKIADAGSVYLMPDLKRPVSLAMNLFLIRLNSQVDQKFIFYLMKLKEGYIKQYANGTSRSTITKDAVRQLRFKIPPLSIQKKIASILSSYDNLIDNNLKMIKILEELALITYEEWFLRLRFPGHEYVAINSKTFLPQGWKYEHFSKHVELLKGIEPGTICYQSQPSSKTIPFLRVKNLIQDFSKVYHVSSSEWNSKICRKEDILLSLDGSPGLVKLGLSGAYSTGIRKTVLKNNSFSQVFIYCYLKSAPVQFLINAHARGTTILHAGSSVKHMKILYPPKKILRDFNDKMMPSFNHILNLLNQNKALNEARDILLGRLMTGVINVGNYDRGKC